MLLRHFSLSHPFALETHKLRDLALLALLAYASWLYFRAFIDFIFEDAYITYRYAANLAAGHGFVFNPGERVLGTSTPLYTLILAFLAWCGLSLPTAGSALFAGSISLLAWAGFQLSKAQGYANAGVAFALFTIGGFGGLLRFFGLETALYAALIFLALWAAARDRLHLCGILMGLMCTTRYDGILAAGWILLFLLWRHRLEAWRSVAWLSLILGSWLLFAWIYFGDPLPNTLGAKAGDVGMFEYMTSSLERQGRFLFSPLAWLISRPRLSPLQTGLLATVLLAPSLLQARHLACRAPALLVLPATAISLWIGYAIIGPPLAHRWYLAPAMFAMLAWSLAGWASLIQQSKWQSWWQPHRASVLSLLGIAMVALALPNSAAHEAAKAKGWYLGNSRVVAYDLFADWISNRDLEDQVIFTREPGYLGYRLEQPIIDGAGLLTRDIYFHGPSQRRSSIDELLDEHQPGLVILGSKDERRHRSLRRDYLPLLTGQPAKMLFLRRNVYQENLDGLHDSWIAKTWLPPEQRASASLPAIDFERAPATGWDHSHNHRYVGRVPAEVTLDGREFPPPYLHTWNPGRETNSLVSKPFLIDFDELTFAFAATHPSHTRVQLFVDGLKVWQYGGRGSADLLELQRVALPMYPWRGQTGQLSFVDASSDGNYLVADLIEPQNYRRQQTFDDFESGEYQQQRWLQSFGDAPQSTLQIAELGGVHLTQGRWLASSLGLEGKQSLISRPFEIEHEFLAFTHYDFGDQGTQIRLLVGGKTVHRLVGNRRRNMSLVRWDLRPYLGREATLAVLDGEPRAGRGIAIDSIRLFDAEEVEN